jgi:AraC-like DNA-binding protein
MAIDIVREITPLTQSDCFTVFSRTKSRFDFPVHNHEEMELTLILNGEGAKRVIGDHIRVISDFELVLIGSNLPHGWFTHNCTSNHIKEITIQFHKDLLDDRFLRRNRLSPIKDLFEAAKHGLSFTQETVEHITPRINTLGQKSGFSAVLELLSVFDELSQAADIQLLSESTFNIERFNYNSRRIENVFEFMNANFSKQITLKEVSKIANMPEASFSRFIKNRTGYTFVDSLTEIRLGHVIRMLIDTPYSVAEIAYKCGFNNMANFNRIFKGKKGCTPKDFRIDYNGHTVFI